MTEPAPGAAGRGAERARAPRIEPLGEVARPAGRSRGGTLPPPLGARLDAPLEIALRDDRPTVIANFVTTLDGVVAFDTAGATGGREVSGSFAPDRFLMGLLRATSDAVLVGAGTARAGRHLARTPADADPAAGPAFDAWRRQLGLEQRLPTTIVVTASGRVGRGDEDAARSALREPGGPILVLTTEAGASSLVGAGLSASVEVAVAGDGQRIDADHIVEALGTRGYDLVLCEGGPTLFAALLGAGLVDELFLTVSPQLAGRAPASPRLALVEGLAFAPGEAPWAELRSVQRAGHHLFLRYGLGDRPGPLETRA